jgi:hypothetical protein
VQSSWRIISASASGLCYKTPEGGGALRQAISFFLAVAATAIMVPLAFAHFRLLEPQSSGGRAGPRRPRLGILAPEHRGVRVSKASNGARWCANEVAATGS